MIAVTGATGVLGRILCRGLEERGEAFAVFSGDLRDPEALNRWIEATAPAALVHLAARVPVVQVNADPATAFDVNVVGTGNLLRAVANSGHRPWLFYASTSHVYRSSDRPLREDDPIEPQTIYGETKELGERVVAFYGRHLLPELPTCIGRIFSYFHETQAKAFLYPALVERLAAHPDGEPFEIRGGEDVRDFLSAEQVVDRILALMDRRCTGVVNVASGQGTKIKDFVLQVAQRDLELRVQQDRPPSTLVADVSRLQEVLHGGS